LRVDLGQRAFAALSASAGSADGINDVGDWHIGVWDVALEK
jgi:hypothetical protein